MAKKILIFLGAGVAVVAGVAAMSAFEAHVINVTAHIENALSVDPEELDFGTVFPQEYLEKEFTVKLSQSFLDEPSADDVRYVIKQKPKCKIINPDPNKPEYAPVQYWNDECPPGYAEMLNLCQFLSKMDGDPDDQNDVSHPGYYMPGPPPTCLDIGTPRPDAEGYLAKSMQDLSDTWIVDLKVPPVEGYVGQDWPEGCPTVPENDKDYGCDLWIEVVDISRVEVPGGYKSVALENKDSNWEIINDDTFGVLVYPSSGPSFDYTLTAQGLQPNTPYSLIYYADPWPGNHPGALIGTGTSDGDGKISMSGSPDLGMDLPHPDDANYSAGAKVWLVPSSGYDAGGKKLTGWNPDQYLFEHHLIQYDDTGTP